MITIHLVSADGATQTLQGKPGMSLMETAVRANAPGIDADCGGLLICATCHVMVREPFASQLPPPAEDELSMLDFTSSPRQPNSRLSCQIHLGYALEGITVDLPASQH